MRKLLLLLLFIIPALASPMSITFNRGNYSNYSHATTYTFTVTVRNNANVTDTYDVNLYTDGIHVVVNDTQDYYYNITNLTAGTSYAKAADVRVTNAAKFNEEYYFCAEVFDINGTWNNSCLYLAIPEFRTIGASLSYDPSNTPTATLAVNATTSNGTTTTRFNTTYAVKNATATCANDTDNETTYTIDFENCTSGVYDIEVDVTADTYTRTKNFRDFYLFRNINFSASFYVIELFGYERPIEEVGSVKGNSTIRVKGSATYDDGTALSWPPDDYALFVVNVTHDEWNISESVRPREDGTYSIDFTAPGNTSVYTITLEAFGKYDETSEITYYLTVNNTVSYAPEQANNTQILGNLNMTVDAQELIVTDGEVVLNVNITNNNSISLTGKPTIVNTNQFTTIDAPSDSVMAKKSRTYPLIIKPKKYTRPGSYNLILSFGTIYGSVQRTIPVEVPSEALQTDRVNVFRYIEYGDNSEVILRFLNKFDNEASVTVRETIDKNVIPSIINIEQLIASCNATDYSCHLDYVVNNGTCSDCSLVGGNLTTNCTSTCTNRTLPVFTPNYNRLIENDPVVEWFFEVGANIAKEVSYTTGKLVQEDWFTEPETTVEVAGVVITPTPTATPTPSPTPTPTPTPSPSPTPKPGMSAAGMVLIILGLIFLFIVIIVAIVAFLFFKKRELVDSILEKYLPKEQGPTTEEMERERLKALFTKDAVKIEKKPKETKPMRVEKRPKKSILKELDKLFSPKKKEEGPTALKPKTLKKEDMDKLKDIGKGFGENL